MAYNFVRASSQHLTATLSLSDFPFTLACWFRASDSGDQQTLVGIQNLLNGHRSNLFAASQIVNDPIVAATTVGGSVAQVQSTTPFTNNTWHHACGVFVSDSSRTVYLDAGGSATTTTTLAPTFGSSTVGVGARHNGTSWGLFAQADIAEVGIWSAALTQQEIESLSRGYTCDKVRPQSLVFYAPLVRDLIDYKGGLTITNNNTATVAAHPRVYA